MSKGTTGWLACPECGEDAIESTGEFCAECSDGETFGHADDACKEPLGPGWTEDDGGKCPNPACGVMLRVSCEDDHAWLDVVES